jgi:hypothetical protein
LLRVLSEVYFFQKDKNFLCSCFHGNIALHAVRRNETISEIPAALRTDGIPPQYNQIFTLSDTQTAAALTHCLFHEFQGNKLLSWQQKVSSLQ